MASKYFPQIYFVLSKLIVPTAYPLQEVMSPKSGNAFIRKRVGSGTFGTKTKQEGEYLNLSPFPAILTCSYSTLRRNQENEVREDLTSHIVTFQVSDD